MFLFKQVIDRPLWFAQLEPRIQLCFLLRSVFQETWTWFSMDDIGQCFSTWALRPTSGLVDFWNEPWVSIGPTVGKERRLTFKGEPRFGSSTWQADRYT